MHDRNLKEKVSNKEEEFFLGKFCSSSFWSSVSFYLSVDRYHVVNNVEHAGCFVLFIVFVFCAEWRMEWHRNSSSFVKGACVEFFHGSVFLCMCGICCISNKNNGVFVFCFVLLLCPCVCPAGGLHLFVLALCGMTYFWMLPPPSASLMNNLTQEGCICLC